MIGGQASLKVWEDRKGVVRGLEKLRREIEERVLSQMATYWFVIDKLDIEKAKKSKVRQCKGALRGIPEHTRI